MDVAVGSDVTEMQSLWCCGDREERALASAGGSWNPPEEGPRAYQENGLSGIHGKDRGRKEGCPRQCAGWWGLVPPPVFQPVASKHPLAYCRGPLLSWSSCV